MGKVFISYKQEERERMRPIASALRDLNIDVWFDEKLEPDRSFTEEIEGLVKTAAAQVVCWSPEAVKSEWVRGEAEKGRQRGTLIAVMLEYCDLPAPFNMHHAEDLVGWTGNVRHPGWRKVVDAIGRKLNRPGLGELSLLLGTAEPEAWKKWAQKYAADPFCEQAWSKAEELEIAGTRERMAQQRVAAQRAAQEQAARAAEDAHRAALEAQRVAAERAADEARRASLDAQRRAAERLRQEQTATARPQYAEPRYAAPPRTDYAYDRSEDETPAPPRSSSKLIVPALAGVIALAAAAYFGSSMLNGGHTSPPAPTPVASQEIGELTVTPPSPRAHPPSHAAAQPDPAENLSGDLGSSAANASTSASDATPTTEDTIVPMSMPASLGAPLAASTPPGVGHVTWAAIPSNQTLNQTYPVEARTARMEGRIILDCGVRDDFGVNCTVVSESPTGYGFGAAALRAATELHANPALSNGTPSPGNRARVAVSFKTELLTATH